MHRMYILNILDGLSDDELANLQQLMEVTRVQGYGQFGPRDWERLTTRPKIAQAFYLIYKDDSLDILDMMLCKMSRGDLMLEMHLKPLLLETCCEPLTPKTFAQTRDAVEAHQGKVMLAVLDTLNELTEEHLERFVLTLPLLSVNFSWTRTELARELLKPARRNLVVYLEIVHDGLTKIARHDLAEKLKCIIFCLNLTPQTSANPKVSKNSREATKPKTFAQYTGAIQAHQGETMLAVLDILDELTEEELERFTSTLSLSSGNCILTRTGLAGKIFQQAMHNLIACLEIVHQALTKMSRHDLTEKLVRFVTGLTD